MKTLNSFLLKAFFLFSIVLFWSCFTTSTYAQQSVTGLGYVDTKTYYKQMANYDDPRGVVTDTNNNIYIIGINDQGYTDTFVAPSIDLSWNSDGSAIYQGTSFFAKYSPQRVLQFAFTLGEGSPNDTTHPNQVQFLGLDIDASNNLYIYGTFKGTIDFDFTSGTNSLTGGTNGSVFLMKVNADNSFGWVNTWAKPSYNTYDIKDITIDKTRSYIYIAGLSGATNFDLDPGAGTDTQAVAGNSLSKFDTNGTYIWGFTYGNLGGYNSAQLAVKESTGDLYYGDKLKNGVAIDFDPGTGTDTKNLASISFFVTRVTTDKTYLGTTILDPLLSPINLVFDSSENFIIAGDFTGSPDFDPSTNTDTKTSLGNSDTFITKWNVSSNPFVADNPYAWSRVIGGANRDNVDAMEVDSSGNIYLGGIFFGQNIDFDFSTGTDLLSSYGNNTESFISIVTNNGDYIKSYSWGSKSSSNRGDIYMGDLEIDSQGRVYSYGSYQEDTDFDLTTAQYIKKGNHYIDYSSYYYGTYLSVFYPYISGVFGITGETYSSESSLSSLTTSEGAITPSFAPSTYSYSKDIINSIGKISLTASPTNANTRITIDGYAISADTQSDLYGLKPGENIKTIKTFSQDSSTSSTYTLTVNREAPIGGSYYQYISSTNIGTTGAFVYADNVELDASGNTYISGNFSGGPIDFGITYENSSLTTGSFLLKLDSNQTPIWVYVWANAGTYTKTTISDIDIDSTGAIYAGGGFYSTVDLNPTATVDSRSSIGGQDAFLIKINSDGTIAYIYTWGGNGTGSTDIAKNIAIDTNNNVLVGGGYDGSTDFDPTTGVNTITNTNSNTNAYISKFSADGSYVWTKTIEIDSTGSGTIYYYGLDVDSLGNVYSIGEHSFSTNVDFDPTAAQDLRSETDYGIFLNKINADGSYGWTKTSRSPWNLSLYDNSGIVVDHEDNIIVGGSYGSSDLYPSYLNPDNQTLEYTTTPGESDDIFLQKYQSNGTVVWVRTIGGLSDDYLYTLAVDQSNNVYYGGTFDGSIDFEYGDGEDILSPTVQYSSPGYVSQLNANGEYIWTYPLYTSGTVDVYAINFDSSSNMYIGGSMGGQSYLNPFSSVDSTTSTGSRDLFLSKFTSGTIQASADLSNLLTSVGSLVPDFDSTVISYNISLDSTVTEIAFTPTAEDSSITGIQINGVSVTNGLISQNFNLDLGTNTFDIQVTASDGTTTKTYAVNVWRDDGGVSPLSTNTNLSALNISQGTLTPTFSSITKTYSAVVTSDISSFTVTPTAEDTDIYLLEVNGTAISSGQTSSPITLATGLNTITITVTAEDRRTTGTYTISVNKDSITSLPGLKIEWARGGFPNSDVSTRGNCTDSLGSIYTLVEVSGAGDINLGYPDSTSTFSDPTITDFILKYNSDGEFQWAREFTSQNNGALQTMFNATETWNGGLNTCTTDSSNNLYIGGYFIGTDGVETISTDLDLTTGTDLRTAQGIGDGFVSKYDSSGNYVSSYIFSSNGDVLIPDQVRAVAVTSQYLYVVGTFYGTNFDIDGTTGSDTRFASSSGTTFISKYTLAGAYVGGNLILGSENIILQPTDYLNRYMIDDREKMSIVADSNDNIYIAGYWNADSIDFNPSSTISDTKTGTGTRDIFISKFNSSLEYVWSRTIASPNISNGLTENYGQIELDDSEDLYIAGVFKSPLTIEGSPTVLDNQSGNHNGYVVKYASDGTVGIIKTLSGVSGFTDIQFINNKFYLSGYFNGTVDFDMDTDITSRTSLYPRNFIEVLDNEFNYLNILLTDERNLSSNVYTSVYGNNIYILGATPFTTKNLSSTYTPYLLTSTLYDENYMFKEFWLLKYKEALNNRIINTDANLLFNDSLYNLPVSSLLFLPEDSVNVRILKPSSTTLLADTQVNMSMNRDWLGVTADGERSSRKALTKNIHNAPGVLSYNMYVPILDSDNISRVVVCPNANSLTDISVNCVNGQSLKVSSTGVTPFVYDNKKYIKLTGSNSIGAIASRTNSFKVTADDIQTGEKIAVTISAIDSQGNIDTDYTGTLSITSNIPGFPTTYTFTADDSGSHTFTSTAITSEGSYTLSTNDSIDTGILGVSDSIIVATGKTISQLPIVYPIEDTEDPVTETPPEEEPPVTTDPDPDSNSNSDPDSGTESPNIVEDLIAKVTNLITVVSKSKILTAPLQYLREMPIPIENAERILYVSVTGMVATSLIATSVASSYPIANILQLSSFLMAGLKIRKKGREYGIVYDSITKEPVQKAIIRVLDKEGKLISTEVTDIYGAFDIDIQNGEYYMQVQTRTHSFPSKVIQGISDSPYENIYHGQVFSYDSTNPITYSIPVDPIDKNFVEYTGMILKNRLHVILSLLQYILMFVGFVFVLIVYLKTQGVFQLVLLSLYLLLILFNLFIWIRGRKKYGTVTDIYGEPIQGIEVGLKEVAFGTVYAKRVTNEKGQYRFLVPGGKYKIESFDPRYTIESSKDLVFDGNDKEIVTINPDLMIRRVA